MIKNRWGLTSDIEPAHEEERISKLKARELFESGLLDTLKAGTFKSLATIHRYLIEDIYDFAVKVREINILRSGFRFAPTTYLEDAIKNIEKYIEMNIAHLFRKGNGRSIRGLCP